MGKKISFVLTIVAVCLLIVSFDSAHASLLTDYFGITLSVDGTGSFDNSWVPVSSTTDYVVGVEFQSNYPISFKRIPPLVSN